MHGWSSLVDDILRVHWMIHTFDFHSSLNFSFLDSSPVAIGVKRIEERIRMMKVDSRVRIRAIDVSIIICKADVTNVFTPV